MWDFTQRQKLAAYILLSAVVVGGVVLLAKRVQRPPIVIYPGPTAGDAGGSKTADYLDPGVTGDRDADSQRERDGGEEKEFEDVVVHVCGAVRNPGVYTLPKDARIADAVKLAGGLQDTAMEESVNMAMRVTDSMQIYVPAMSSPVSASDAIPAAMGASDTGRININTATISELKKLRGIGPTLAERIVEFRTVNGRFHCPEDLMKVSGIGKKKYADLEESITVY